MIRTNKMSTLLKRAQSYGVAPEALLEELCMPSQILEGRGALSESDTLAILRLLASRCPREFPFQIGAQARQLDLGIVGHALLSARKMRDLIALWVQYSDVVGYPIRFQTRVFDNYWVLDMSPRFPMPDRVLRFLLEEAISSHAPLGRDVLGADFIALRYELALPSGGDEALYEKWLDAPVLFNCDDNRIVMDRDLLECDVLTADDEVRQICEMHCSKILQEIEEADQTATAVRNYFLMRKGTIPTEAEVADAMGISVRSLHRRLSAEGYNYQGLVGSYRRDYAYELLRDQSLRVKEIAWILGYSSTSSFRRAFKEWTGCTVKDWLSKTE